MEMRYWAPLAWVPSGWQVLPAAAGAVTAARLMNVRTMSSRFLMRSSSVPGHECVEAALRAAVEVGGEAGGLAGGEGAAVELSVHEAGRGVDEADAIDVSLLRRRAAPVAVGERVHEGGVGHRVGGAVGTEGITAGVAEAGDVAHLVADHLAVVAGIGEEAVGAPVDDDVFLPEAEEAGAVDDLALEAEVRDPGYGKHPRAGDGIEVGELAARVAVGDGVDAVRAPAGGRRIAPVVHDDRGPRDVRPVLRRGLE